MTPLRVHHELLLGALVGVDGGGQRDGRASGLRGLGRRGGVALIEFSASAQHLRSFCLPLARALC